MGMSVSPILHVRELPEFASLMSLDRSPADYSGFWTPPDFWDADDLAREMTDDPNIWTDGSRAAYPRICCGWFGLGNGRRVW